MLKTLTEQGLMSCSYSHLCVEGSRSAPVCIVEIMFVSMLVPMSVDMWGTSLGACLHCEDRVRVHSCTHVYVDGGNSCLASLGSLGARLHCGDDVHACLCVCLYV